MAKKKATHGGAREGAGREKKYAAGRAVTFYLPAEAIGRLDELAAEMAKRTGAKVGRSAALVDLLSRSKITGQSVREGRA